jgi:hypothetical protein
MIPGMRATAWENERRASLLARALPFLTSV